MKKFVSTLLFFILIPLLVGAPLDYLLTRELLNSKRFAQGEIPVWNDIYSGRIDSDLLVYGSSRAWVHFDPQILKQGLGFSSYNLGMDGSNFRLQHFRHETLLNYNRKPKIILLSVDVFSLPRKEGISNFRQFLPFMLFNRELAKTTSEFSGYATVDYYIPFIRYLNHPKTILHPVSSRLDPPMDLERTRGFKGMDLEWNKDLARARAKLGRYEAKVDKALVELLDEFLVDCNKKEIKVIFVYAPEYIEGQQFVKNRSEVLAVYDRIADKHDVPFLDYSGDRLSRERRYFYNAGHLNREGAEIFTRKLVRDLRSTTRQPSMRNFEELPVLEVSNP